MSLRDRFHEWLDSSVSHRILLAAQGTLLALLVTLGLLSFPIFFITALDNHRDHVENVAARVTDRYQDQFDSVLHELQQLASNSLVINSLVDSVGRETYLHAHMRDFRLPFGVAGTILLYDSNLTVFAANWGLLKPDVVNAVSWANDAIRTGRPGLAVAEVAGSKHVILVLPMFYPPSGTAEAALVAVVRSDELFPPRKDTFVSGGCLTISGSSEPFLRYGCDRGDFWGTVASSGKLIWSGSQFEFTYLETRQKVIARLFAITLAYLAVCCIVLWLGYLASNRLATRFTSSLAELAEVSRGIVEGRVVDRAKVEWQKPDEIGLFVGEFNNMVDELSTARLMLEARVAERTAELEKALVRADSATAAKDRFLATMSHEIRTPMNGILGLAHLLSEPDLDVGTTQRYANAILGSGNTLLALLNDILDISKADAGQLKMAFTTVKISTLLTEVAELFSAAALRKGTRVDLHVANLGDQLYMADPTRLRQVLSNLLSNSIKFTEGGRIDLRVEELIRQDDVATLRFSVDDTGIGIDEDAQKVLFKPFSQVDDSSTRAAGGTGLGLFVVKTLAELMGGTVGVTSRPGEGSCFWFTISAAVSTSKLEPANSVTPTENRPEFNGHVLVVEDNLLNLMLIQKMLERAGLTVSTVVNGEEALQKRQEVHYDLILMDCQMPVMDGYQSTREIRRWERSSGASHVPIVALTAAAFDDDRTNAFSAGMDGFLAKPINPPQLWAELSLWLSRRKMAAEAQEETMSPP
jgi:signal transduction histidine kinase/AmiR/NasT family two-component response regulator